MCLRCQAGWRCRASVTMGMIQEPPWFMRDGVRDALAEAYLCVCMRLGVGGGVRAAVPAGLAMSSLNRTC